MIELSGQRKVILAEGLFLFLLVFVFLIQLFFDDKFISGSPTDVIKVYKFVSIILIPFTIIYIYFNLYNIKKLNFVYIVLVVMMLRFPILVLNNPWFIEEYWRFGRSYEATVMGKLPMVGLNKENPLPFIYMSQLITVTGLKTFLILKIFDLFELFFVSLMLYYITRKTLGEHYFTFFVMLFWGLMYIPLGHFSRQDFAFMLYLTILGRLFLDVKHEKNSNAFNYANLAIITVSGVALVYSHPATPLILVFQLIAIYLFIASNILLKTSKSEDRLNLDKIKEQFKTIVYLLSMAWLLWHTLSKISRSSNIMVILKDSVVNSINSIISYGISSTAVLSQRKIVHIDQTYSRILEMRQFVLFLVVITSLYISYKALKELYKNKLSNTILYINLRSILGLYLSSILLMVLIAFSGHVPFRGLLFYSIPLVVLFAYSSFSSSLAKRYLLALSLLSIILSPVLSFTGLPLVYSSDSELNAISYGIVHRSDYMADVYLLEYNGPILGYFYNYGKLPVIVHPGPKVLRNALKGDYSPLVVVHRLSYRDHFLVYNISDAYIKINSYNKLIGLLIESTRSTNNMIYQDTSNNFILG